MISVSDLVYEYPTQRVLHAVGFEIQPRTITALVGPNGAGKTTLLRCLAALELPYSGRVRVAGLDTVEQPRECHAQVGYLSDFFGLYGALSVRQSLTYLALAHHMPTAAIPARVDEVAAALGLAERLDQRTAELSRGLRQRVAIGQAIIHRPQVLLLDEPAAGLDPEARSSLSQLLVRLRDEGMTIMVSSHILAELEEYSTHMLVLREGRIRGHQALQGSDPAAATLQLRIRCAESAGDLGAWLQARRISAQTADEAVSFTFSADPVARRDLLRELIEAGFPVIEFAEHKRNLQELYLADAAGEVTA